MGSENNVIFSDILCFVQCKFGIVPKLSLQTAINGFYDVEVICNAKKSLYEIAEKIIPDLPRPKVRQGENKKKKESEDLVDIFEQIDKANCNIPTFATSDLNKIPCIKAADADIGVLIVKMEQMQEMIVNLRLQLSDIVKEQVSLRNKKVIVTENKNRNNEANIIGFNEGQSSDLTVALPDKVTTNKFKENSKKISEVVQDWQDKDEGKWKIVQPKKKTKIPSKFGNRTENKGKSLKAAKTKRSWHFYIGNLSKGTTTDDICDFLLENKVDVLCCEQAGHGYWDDRPAAFHVEINYEKKDDVMCESFWDTGVKIRNWIFPKKKN